MLSISSCDVKENKHDAVISTRPQTQSIQWSGGVADLLKMCIFYYSNCVRKIFTSNIIKNISGKGKVVSVLN